MLNEYRYNRYRDCLVTEICSAMTPDSKLKKENLFNIFGSTGIFGSGNLIFLLKPKCKHRSGFFFRSYGKCSPMLAHDMP